LLALSISAYRRTGLRKIIFAAIAKISWIAKRENATIKQNIFDAFKSTLLETIHIISWIA
jgi:hypothetical protein